MSSAHLSGVPEGQREGGEEEERRSFVPWSGSLAHANRAAASGETLARVLMELGQTHFTAYSHGRGGIIISLWACACVLERVCVRDGV